MKSESVWRTIRSNARESVLRKGLDEREIVGRSNQDGFAISDGASECAINRPLVAFDDAPLSAGKVNS
jgi:hypothetical protein